MYPLLVEYFLKSSAGLGGRIEQILSGGAVSTPKCKEGAFVDRSLERKFVMGFVYNIPLLFINTGFFLITGFNTVIAFKSTRASLKIDPLL